MRVVKLTPHGMDTGSNSWTLYRGIANQQYKSQDALASFDICIEDSNAAAFVEPIGRNRNWPSAHFRLRPIAAVRLLLIRRMRSMLCRE